jgi:hypothetical protein
VESSRPRYLPNASVGVVMSRGSLKVLTKMRNLADRDPTGTLLSSKVAQRFHNEVARQFSVAASLCKSKVSVDEVVHRAVDVCLGRCDRVDVGELLPINIYQSSLHSSVETTAAELRWNATEPLDVKHGFNNKQVAFLMQNCEWVDCGRTHGSYAVTAITDEDDKFVGYRMWIRGYSWLSLMLSKEDVIVVVNHYQALTAFLTKCYPVPHPA